MNEVGIYNHFLFALLVCLKNVYSAMFICSFVAAFGIRFYSVAFFSIFVLNYNLMSWSQLLFVADVFLQFFT